MWQRSHTALHGVRHEAREHRSLEPLSLERKTTLHHNVEHLNLEALDHVQHAGNKHLGRAMFHRLHHEAR